MGRFQMSRFQMSKGGMTMVRFITYIIAAIISGVYLHHFRVVDDVPSAIADTFAIIALYRTCKYNKEE